MKSTTLDYLRPRRYTSPHTEDHYLVPPETIRRADGSASGIHSKNTRNLWKPKGFLPPNICFRKPKRPR